MTSKTEKAKKKDDIKVTFDDHKKMIVWKSMDDLDTTVQNLLKIVPRNGFKIRSRIDNISDSLGANFVKG